MQQRRPEVSAALAAVVERATAKALGRRYARAAELTAELEEALAIETARTGSADGREATVVLRSLPSHASERVPLRARHPAVLGALGVLAIAAVAAIVVLALTRTHHGTAPPPDLPGSTTQVDVDLSQNAASQYNPFGTSPEDPSTVGLAIDGNPDTAWSTSTYLDGVLGKSGVGFYVDAKPGVAADRAVLETPTPGFDVQVWGADRVQPWSYTPQPRPGISPSTLGWTLLGSAERSAAPADDHARERAPPPLLPAVDHEPRARPGARLEERADRRTDAPARCSASGAVAALTRVARDRDLAELLHEPG